MTKGYEYNKIWRQKHPELRYSSKKRYYQKTVNSPNSGNRWTYEEIVLISNSELPDSELSKLLGRSVGSIQHKRFKVKHRRNS